MLTTGSRVRLRALATLAVAGGVLLGVACTTSPSDGGGGDAAPVETLPPTTLRDNSACDLPAAEEPEPIPEGVALGVVPTLPAGVDTGYTGQGLGSGNPYVVPGARPVPGPDMPVTTLGPDPISIAVAAPPNPDLGHPATLVPGQPLNPRAETTLPPVATTMAPAAANTTTTGLTPLADDPGCVSVRGEP